MIALSVWSKNDDAKRLLIIDKYENPKFKIDKESAQKLSKDYHFLKAYSNSCMDNFDFYLKIKDHQIIDIKYCGEGCVISISANEILCENILETSQTKAIKIFENFLQLVTTGKPILKSALPEIFFIFDKLYLQPGRINCASLATNSLLKFLESHP